MATVSTLDIQIKAHDEATRTLQHVSDQLRTTGQSATQMGVVVGAAAGATMTALNALGQAAGAALSAIGASTIGMNSKLEQSSVAFTTMLGSGEKAAAFLKDLQQFAATTPFEFPELVKASQSLLGMGIAADQVRPLLTAVGNAVASMGGGAEQIDRVTRALGQMQAKGKVQGDELLQLSEAGINGYRILAETMGTDVATAMDKVSKGQVQASTFIQAFIADTNTRLGGMMEAQSKTFAGSLSTLRDVARDTIGGAFKPFFDVISSITVKLADFAQSETVSVWAQDLGIKLGALAPILGQIADWLMAQLPGAMSAAEAAVGQFVAVVQSISAVWDQVTGALDGVWQRIQQGIDATLAPVRSLIGIFQALGQAIDTVTTDITGNVTPLGGRIAGIFNDVIIPALDAFRNLWAEGWQTIQIVAVDAINAAIPVFEQLRLWLGENLLPAIAGLQQAWEGFWSRAAPIVEALWGRISPVLEGLRDWLSSQLGTAVAAATKSFAILGDKIGSFFSWLGGVLKPIADQVGGQFAEMVDGLIASLQAGQPQAAAAAEETATVVRQAFIKGTAPLATEVEATAKPAADAIGKVGTAASTAATAGLAPLATNALAAATGLDATKVAAAQAALATRDEAEALEAIKVAALGGVKAMQDHTDQRERERIAALGGEVAIRASVEAKEAEKVAALGGLRAMQEHTDQRERERIAALGGEVAIRAAAEAKEAEKVAALGGHAAMRLHNEEREREKALALGGAALLDNLTQARRKAEQERLAQLVLDGEITRTQMDKRLADFDRWQKGEVAGTKGIKDAHADLATGVEHSSGRIARATDATAQASTRAAQQVMAAMAVASQSLKYGAPGQRVGGEAAGFWEGIDELMRQAADPRSPYHQGPHTPGPGAAPGQPTGVGPGTAIGSGGSAPSGGAGGGGGTATGSMGMLSAAALGSGLMGALPLPGDIPEAYPGRPEAFPGVFTGRPQSNPLADPSIRAFDQLGRAGTEAFAEIQDAARHSMHAVAQATTTTAFQAAQAFLTLEQHMTTLKQRAQDLIAGVTRTAFGTTAQGLNATQIYAGTGQMPRPASGTGGFTPGSYYGVPVVSPVTPGYLPGFADGGLVTRPTMAMLGERGPEAIIPLDRGLGGPTVNLNVTVQSGPLSVASESQRKQEAREIAERYLVPALRSVGVR